MCDTCIKRTIKVYCMYNFSFGFWNCSGSVVLLFGTVPAVWYYCLELFRQCGIIVWNCSGSVVLLFGTVPAVWYYCLELFRQCGIIVWNCSGSVVLLFGTVPAVWYYCVSYSLPHITTSNYLKLL